jgi:PAS domain S-box-containing protein
MIPSTKTKNVRILTALADDRAFQRTTGRVTTLEQAILENAGQAVVATDGAGIIQTFNPAAERLLGYRAEEVVGCAAPMLIHASHELMLSAVGGPSDANDRLAALAGLAQVGRPVEWTLLCKDGTPVPVMLALTALHAEDGEVTGYVGVVTDISSIKLVEDNLRRSEETLRVANAELARTLRIRDEFLASMSHELRTPLAAILSLSEGLSDEVAGPLNERQRKYVSTITESGQHLLALINDVLDLSKIEAGRLELEREPLDVDLVCHASLRLVKEQAQHKGLTATLRIDDSIQSIVADERRLKQILVNLLSNAVKFTPDGGSYGIDVRADRVARNVSFCVWDTGIGIEPGYLPFLFQPFVQVDSRLARKQGGTGLGLALVRRMAELHAGAVEVKSTPGKGTRFVVTLPWEPDVDEGGAGAVPLPYAAATGLLLPQNDVPTGRTAPSSVLAHSTILLVEDNESAAMAVQDYLASRGATVLKARSGSDALQIALAVRPDLILMDIQMPDMDGIETTRRLRAYPHMRSVIIIALTALAMSEDRDRCLTAGMDDYIAKPVEFRRLAQLIEIHLSGQRGAS